MSRQSRILICGPTCGHDHDSINGPTGCCAEHGPYMYFCADCQAARRTESAEPPLDIAVMARNFSLWLNSTYPADLSEETVFWRRVGKISEEAGEVREASGAYWHENPRKPKGPLEDVIKELSDCVGAALGAIEHLTGHEGRSLEIVAQRIREVCERVGVPTTDGA